MDMQEHNGWSNVFTWHIYNHLSSYPDTSAIAQSLSAEAMHEWIEGIAEMLFFEQCAVSGIGLLFPDLVNAVLRQVDWDELVEHFKTDERG